MKKRGTHILETVWALIMVAVISSTLTLLLATYTTRDDAHWVSEKEYETIDRYRRLEEVRSTLSDNYYTETDEDALILGAIRGMTAAVNDPYTFYYTPEEMTASRESSEGLYHGLGILVQRNEEGYMEALRIYGNSPAEAAGIRPGDVITGVNGYEIVGSDEATYNEAIQRMRGLDGEEVTLAVSRDGEMMNITAVFSSVSISFADYCMLENGVGYVSIAQFTGDAADKFAEAIKYFKAQDASAMIIDLRNNSGGLLDVVLSIADSILPEGVIVYMQDRAGKQEKFYSDDAMYDIPLAVLVNGRSASASELLAAAVKCFDRGEIVGMNTFGKGIVQSVVSFEEDGAGMQLTTASYYAGDGTSIHGVGVAPDIEVALIGDRIPVDPDPVSDNQLAAAIEVLEKTIGAPVE